MKTNKPTKPVGTPPVGLSDLLDHRLYGAGHVGDGKMSIFIIEHGKTSSLHFSPSEIVSLIGTLLQLLPAGFEIDYDAIVNDPVFLCIRDGIGRHLTAAEMVENLRQFAVSDGAIRKDAVVDSGSIIPNQSSRNVRGNHSVRGLMTKAHPQPHRIQPNKPQTKSESHEKHH